jgi:replicative DNA helicase
MDNPGNITALPTRREGIGPGAVGLREAPHNLEMEAALLGAILRNNRAFEDTSDIVEEQHFHAPEHQRIYRAIRKVVEQGQIASAITLKHWFDRDEGLKLAGGAVFTDMSKGIVHCFGRVNFSGHLIHSGRKMLYYRGLVAL